MRRSQPELADLVRQYARPLDPAGDADPVVDLIGDADVVLLGEATHGTHEFYALRAAISKRLIRDHGFAAVAVEADWPDALQVSRYVQGRSAHRDADAALGGFVRFPRWMWRNREVRQFVQWLREHNDAFARLEEKAGFYGLDVYSLHTSMQAVIDYLLKVDPAAAAEARKRYACFDNLALDPQRYGQAIRFGVMKDCRREVALQLRQLFEQAGRYDGSGGAAAADELFHAQQNARVVRNAESYYRIMFEGHTESWNLRDTHMAETLQQLREHLARQRGQPARIVVWAHNSHLGDARATEWADERQLNLGQLVREQPEAFGKSFSLGFTTHAGTVAAASDWDDPVELKAVRPSRADSFERLLHDSGIGSFVLPLGGALQRPLGIERLERAIGVIYRPDTERYSHYFSARLSEQFDAVVHIDQTRAVTPLDPSERWVETEVPETFPTGI